MMDTAAAQPPVYKRIARVIRSRMFHGLYAPGAAIPSEHELAAEFGVARLTIRQALQELRSDGSVISKRGAATYVRPGARIKRPAHFVGYLEDHILQSLPLVTTLGAIKTVAAPAEVRKAYGLPARARVVRLERTRFMNGQPAQFSVNYLRPEIAKKLPLAKLASGSLTQMLADHAKLTTTSAKQRISAVGASADIARALKLKAGAPLLVSEVVGYRGRQVVAYVQLYYRPELFSFEATLISVGDSRAERHNGHPAQRLV